jgi:hypothetical protein
LAFASRVRNVAGTSTPPMILLTSLGSIGRAEALAGGCAGLLTKPVKRDALIEVLAETIGAVAPAATPSLVLDPPTRHSRRFEYWSWRITLSINCWSSTFSRSSALQ